MNGTLHRLFPKVTKIKDAKATIKIEVTPGDVKKSKRMKHGDCAMAEACKRSLKVDGVLIARSVSYLVKGTTATRFLTPMTVSREITSFDRGGSFEPGTYILSKALKKVGGSRNPHKNRGNGKPKKYIHHTENIRVALPEAA